MIVIITGMHRSGTSMLAGLLHESGIVMGTEKTFYPPPLPENPKGFFENYDFRILNDRILESCGYRVKSFQPDLPEIKASWFSRIKMKNLIAKQDKQYASWGWKDPRTCLTLKLWLGELAKRDRLQKCAVVHIYRDPLSVAQSLVSRKNTDFKSGLKLWATYNKNVLDQLDQFDVRSFFVRYEDLMSSSDAAMTALFSFLKIKFDPQRSREFIDPNLDRSDAPKNNASECIESSFLVTEILEKLNRRCSSSCRGRDSITTKHKSRVCHE